MSGEKQSNSLGKRFERSFGPVLAGLVIDSLDFATLGTLGIMIGMLVGGSAAFYICSIMELKIWKRVLIATLAGFYCAMPRTEFIPAATLVGAVIRFLQTEKREEPEQEKLHE